MSTLSVQTITDVRSFDFGNTQFSGAYNASNAAFVTANAAYNNANVGLAAANTWANTVGTAGNNYAIAVGASANNWANTKLSNTSGTFAGSLVVTGSVTATGSFIAGSARTIPSTGGLFFDVTGINNDIIANGRTAGITGGWGSLRVHQNATYPGLKLVGDTSQTASYMELENSTGTTFFKIDSTGRTFIYSPWLLDYSASRQLNLAANNNIEFNIAQQNAKVNGKIWNILVDSGNVSANCNFAIRQLNDFGVGIGRGFLINGETGVFSTYEARKISPASVPAGSVIQTVFKNLGGIGSYYQSGTSARSNTNFNATFTPQYSTSKVFHMIVIGFYANCDGNLYIYRNGSIVSDSLGDSMRTITYADASVDWFPITVTWLDSPGSTSTLTYSLYAQATGCGQTMYVGTSGDFSPTWTMMEIAQ